MNVIVRHTLPVPKTDNIKIGRYGPWLLNAETMTNNLQILETLGVQVYTKCYFIMQICPS